MGYLKNCSIASKRDTLKLATKRQLLTEYSTVKLIAWKQVIEPLGKQERNRERKRQEVRHILKGNLLPHPFWPATISNRKNINQT